MAIARGVYIALYVIYLVLVALLLWFFLHFAKVPAWVWILLVVPIAIFLVGLALKETVIKGERRPDGTLVFHTSTGWEVFYIAAHVVAFIVFGIGFIFAMINSDIQWWIWPFFGIGTVLTVVATMFFALLPTSRVVGLTFGIIGIILMLVGGVLILVSTEAPWWAWLLGGLVGLLAILTLIFEYVAAENVRDVVNAPITMTTVPTVAGTTTVPTNYFPVTVATTQLGPPEYLVAHTGQYNAAGQAKYSVVHTEPHPNQVNSTTQIPIARVSSGPAQPAMTTTQNLVSPQPTTTTTQNFAAPQPTTSQNLTPQATTQPFTVPSSEIPTPVTTTTQNSVALDPLSPISFPASMTSTITNNSVSTTTENSVGSGLSFSVPAPNTEVPGFN
jgi:hypothetical protein